MGGSEQSVQEEVAPEGKESEAETKVAEETQSDDQQPEQRNEAEYDLEAKLEAVSTTAAEDAEFQDFKVLSDEDFEDLVFDDVEEGVKYQHKLSRYKEWRGKKGHSIGKLSEANAFIHEMTLKRENRPIADL